MPSETASWNTHQEEHFFEIILQPAIIQAVTWTSARQYKCELNCDLFNTTGRLRKSGLTRIIKQHILWFQVSVDDPVLVEVLQAADDLGCVETRSLLVEAGILLIHVVHVEPARRTRRNRDCSLDQAHSSALHNGWSFLT